MKLIDWFTGKIQTIKGWLFGNLTSEQMDKLKSEIDEANKDSCEAKKCATSANVGDYEDTSGENPYLVMCRNVKRLLDANGFLSKGVLRHDVRQACSKAGKDYDESLFQLALQNRSRGYSKVPPQNERKNKDNRINDCVYYSENWLADIGECDVISAIKQQIASKIRNLREEYGRELNDPYRLQQIMRMECDEVYGVVSNENYADMMLCDLAEPAFDFEDQSLEI